MAKGQEEEEKTRATLTFNWAGNKAALMHVGVAKISGKVGAPLTAAMAVAAAAAAEKKPKKKKKKMLNKYKN